MHLFRQLRRCAYAAAISLDLLVSALTMGSPWARLGRARRRNERVGMIGAEIVDWSARVFFAQNNHCTGALLAFEARERASGEVG